MHTIYFDHNATTPVHPDVFNAMEPFFKEQFGNASNLYRLGVDARYAVEKARAQIAFLINADADEIVFTGGGTEADNLAIKGIVAANGKNHLIISGIEHPAVKMTCEYLEQYHNCRITQLPVDKNGRIDPRDVEKAITPETALVSIMLANNEIGAIQPIEDIAKITRFHAVPFHTDAVQAAGKIPVDVQTLGVDLLSLAGHKIYGPKGVGALYVKRGVQLIPQVQGGNHENGRRAGTENVPGIVGFGQAAELALHELPQRNQHDTTLRDLLWEKLSQLPFAILRNSPATNVLPNTLNVSIHGINAREFVRAMDKESICLSSGSACSQGKTEPSSVLKAIGRTDEEAAAAIRISVGRMNTREDVGYFIETITSVIKKCRGI
ncbi:MAG: cysteine desulfurase [Candidatus Omnitrophota bacterium]|jgi:cysteine desulfurase|nr:MAG: cysteine desulfurase [Candidatus Omnitrophota bacterium]